MNATFGNAAELIIAIAALQKGLYDVVKASLTGSIIGNILLVFGLSALAGGFRNKTQRFNATAASAQAIPSPWRRSASSFLPHSTTFSVPGM